jgi:hypothetical protein
MEDGHRQLWGKVTCKNEPAEQAREELVFEENGARRPTIVGLVRRYQGVVGSRIRQQLKEIAVTV